MAWQTPKVDWTTADGVASADMNRIEGNAAALKTAASIDIVDAGNVIAATNVEAALQELATDLVNGKTSLAGAITTMGQSSAATDSIATMASKVLSISSDATAAVGDVLSGKTFYSGSVKRTGTMTDRSTGAHTQVGISNNGTGTLWLNTPQGYYTSASSISVTDGNFVPGNLKADVSALGMTGTYTSDGTAVAADMISGKVAYSNGVRYVGTVTDQSSYTNALSVAGSNGVLYVRIPNGAYRANTGVGYPEIVVNDANFTTDNIRGGASFLGMTGTGPSLKMAKMTATGPATWSNYIVDLPFSGMAFTPVFAAIYYNGGLYKAGTQPGATVPLLATTDATTYISGGANSLYANTVQIALFAGLINVAYGSCTVRITAGTTVSGITGSGTFTILFFGT